MINHAAFFQATVVKYQPHIKALRQRHADAGIEAPHLVDVGVVIRVPKRPRRKENTGQNADPAHFLVLVQDEAVVQYHENRAKLKD